MSFYTSFFSNLSVSKARKLHQFAYSTSSEIEDWELTTAKVCLYTEILMNASAFRDIWAQVIFSKLSKLHERPASAIWEPEKYHEWPYITKSMSDDTSTIFLYIIFAIIVIRKSKNMTVTLLWTPNSVMASMLLTCFISTKQLQCNLVTGKLSVNYF